MIPRPEMRGLPPRQLPPWQSHRLTQPGQLILPQPLTPLSFLPPAWHQKKSRKRNSLLMELGVSTCFLGPCGGEGREGGCWGALRREGDEEASSGKAIEG